jgi:toxin FitB
VSGFLLDTNVISELVKAKPEPGVTRWIEATDENLLYLSVLTVGEIRCGIAALPQASRRAILEAWLEADLRIRFGGASWPLMKASRTAGAGLPQKPRPERRLFR